jgi:hypothetical protein
MIPSSATADIPLERYNDFKNNVPQFKDYLVGVGRGIFWANAVLRATGRPRLFCMPENLKLDEGIILSLVDQEIRDPSSGKSWGSDAPVEMIMAFAFKNRFPCK